MKKSLFFSGLIFIGIQYGVFGQWNIVGNNIYNTNSGFVGIGTSSPVTLLHAGKNMTEPNIMVHNMGGTGGATFTMKDDASGANWKFKATLAGGFKIRDHANGLDVIVIEPNSFSNAIYIKSTDNIGVGTATPQSSAVLDISSSTKGLLPPRMTNVQMHAISNPTDGLLVYCTDCSPDGIAGCMAIYMGGQWFTFSVNDCPSSPAAPAEGTHDPGRTQITWNWNIVTGATGYKWNTTDNYATAENLGTLTTKTETGLTEAIPYTRYAWAYNSCGYSIVTVLTDTTLTLQCGDDLMVEHVAGTVAPVSKSVTYGTVNNVPGEESKCWITTNLGADYQAYAVNDNSEQSAGWYWQFNKQQGYKHDGGTRTPNTTWITSISENSNWLAANDPCNLLLESGWRLPTYAEYNNVITYGGWADCDDAWGSLLKMHAAGYLNYSSGALMNRGTYGYYWSSVQISNTNSWRLYFSTGNCTMGNLNKAYAFTVRCLKN